VPSILPSWSGEGSLPSSEVADVAAGEREGWAALRSLQGEPTCDVVRYVLTGGDPPRGIPATRTLVPNLTGLPVLVSNLTELEARAYGGVDFAAGDRRFELFTDVRVLQTDSIRFPASTGDLWVVWSVYWDPFLGQTIAFCRLAKGA